MAETTENFMHQDFIVDLREKKLDKLYRKLVSNTNFHCK